MSTLNFSLLSFWSLIFAKPLRIFCKNIYLIFFLNQRYVVCLHAKRKIYYSFLYTEQNIQDRLGFAVQITLG